MRPVRSCARLKERLSFSQGRGQNPYGGGRTASNNSRTATSSSSQHAPKRQKLGHLTSKHFDPPSSERRTRSKPAQAIPSPSPPPPDNITDAIVIEDDTPDLNDSSSKPDTLTSSSPDPMDIIPHIVYSFDSSKPSPIHQLSSSLEKTRRSPTDGESTARLRAMNQDEDRHSPSRIYGAFQPTKGPVTPMIETSPRPDGLLQKGKVKELTNYYEGHREREVVPHRDLRIPRKVNMKSKQVSIFAPQSAVPQPSDLQAPAEGSAVNIHAERSARHWTIWLRFWFGILKGQSGSKRRSLQFTLGSMVHRGRHPSARSNT